MPYVQKINWNPTDCIALIFEKFYPEINNLIQYRFVQKTGTVKNSWSYRQKYD